MEVGLLGIGRMGEGILKRLGEAGIKTYAWNRSPHKLANVQDVDEMIDKMTKGERIVWLMLPSGEVVEEKLAKILPKLTKGDVIVDGGNSNYKDSMRRAKEAQARGVAYLDVGVSGGPRGAREGACLMIGGGREVYDRLLAVWEAVAAPDAFAYLGASGAGHFAKMIHNGIEYGMMQAIAEGVAVLEASPFNFDLERVLDIYNHRSVIESRLVEWTRLALVEDGKLTSTKSQIDHTGEGEWTVEAARELGVEVPVITESLEVRKRSGSEPPSFRNKLVSAMRGQFGGHKVKNE